MDTYCYRDVIKELNKNEIENLHFKDIKEQYYASLCSDGKIRWCFFDRGYYKDENLYSKQTQEYMKNAQFLKVIGTHPWI
ncbi:hypothetical protein BC351_00495 [Paenibacillus ferrarius]|uniref:Uncharacterized protein n=1 Tax=Paenibacillus ferrarius TaxID=1469647 RepID=A0A1V4HT59_9BACL|nr:hypothetical protein [Paenibacillus ferrarius]OPH61755.1 hypothetical protein BC351_00495 [Paenibacillus ferrarius]